jgi:hypothetical protein
MAVFEVCDQCTRYECNMLVPEKRNLKTSMEFGYNESAMAWLGG